VPRNRKNQSVGRAAAVGLSLRYGCVSAAAEAAASSLPAPLAPPAYSWQPSANAPSFSGHRSTRCLTLRSRRPTTASSLARQAGWRIFHLAGKAARRGGRLSSNVRRTMTKRLCTPPPHAAMGRAVTRFGCSFAVSQSPSGPARAGGSKLQRIRARNRAMLRLGCRGPVLQSHLPTLPTVQAWLLHKSSCRPASARQALLASLLCQRCRGCPFTLTSFARAYRASSRSSLRLCPGCYPGQPMCSLGPRAAPNYSLEATHYGRQRLAASGSSAHFPCAASRRLPPWAPQLER
jgi:hypothetical protein